MKDPKQWAEDTFANAKLKDYRHTERLIKITRDLAENAGTSIPRASSDDAAVEGAYRFLRNQNIDTHSIALAGYNSTLEKVKETKLVLSVQDTTGLAYRHSVCEQLGSVPSANKDKPKAKGRSLFVHSTLMLDASNGHTIGLGNQHYWHRENKVEGNAQEKKMRDRREKESFKWQRNLEQLSERYGSLSNVIDVCDREADSYEYLDYQLTHGHRFVVRANRDRRLSSAESKLSEVFNELEPQAYAYVKIAQRGGRKARNARVALRYTTVTFKKHKNLTKVSKTLTVNVVQCQEVDTCDNNEKLCWNLYTSEAINNTADAQRIIQYYEWRWTIEEFHKVWKSDGMLVESLRMQTKDTLERAALILAFVATYLYQLRDLAQNNESAKSVPCTGYLTSMKWKLLWKAVEKTKPPEQPPSLYWAYYAIAKLGKWYDSKRNGKVGVKAYWTGWLKLMDMEENFKIFKELELD